MTGGQTHSRLGEFMPSDNDKRLEDWKIASKKYCNLLEEVVEELRGKREVVPDENTLTELAKKIEVIRRAGQCFRDDINQASKSAPSPPSPDYRF
jgi:hypothetical protein